MSNDSSIAQHVVNGLRPFFYLHLPSDSSYETLRDVPNYVQRVLPYFIMSLGLEAVVRVLQGKPAPRINDSVNSLTAGMLMLFMDFFTGSFAVVGYSLLYQYFHLVDFDWDSPWTWWIAFFGVDLAYYWFHRMAHEINLFWGAHQVHHSSEDYTLSTALRQSALQRFTSWFFYLPMAVLGIPATAYLVHKQLNLLYQFWIHTEVVDKLGPLEWVLNTPSHHRVHHGRNRYCIDKNYAGVLIIWDRMFGTFQPEGPKVIYGLVHPLASWNPLWAQASHLVYLWGRFWSAQGLRHKLCVLFKGPGWNPGTARLGNPLDIPETPLDPRPYDVPVSRWVRWYCLIHFLVVLYATQEVAARQHSLAYLWAVGLILYFTLSITNFGLMFEGRSVCAKVEVFRLLLVLVVDAYLMQQGVVTGLSTVVSWMFRSVACFSLGAWAVVLAKVLFQEHKAKLH